MKRTVIFSCFIVLLSLLGFTGCSIKQDNQISTVKGHAYVRPSMDPEHYRASLNGSTIFIKKINGKIFNEFSKRLNVEQISPAGKISIYIEEDNFSDYIFGATLYFEAVPQEEYIVSSTHIIENDKIIEVEFYVLNRGKVITRQTAKRVRKASKVPLYMPTTI